MTHIPYTHTIRVPYKDTDQMGVVHHANYINWFEMARTEMMRHDGIAYKEMEQLGLLLPVLDIQVEYRSPAYYDDVVAIATKITSFSVARLQFSYEIRRTDTGNESTNKLLATGQSLHMWLTNEWRPARFHKIAPDIYARLKDKYGTV